VLFNIVKFFHILFVITGFGANIRAGCLFTGADSRATVYGIGVMVAVPRSSS
jgi:hypothetical protein